MHLDNYTPPPLVPFWGTEKEEALLEKIDACQDAHGRTIADGDFLAVGVFGSRACGLERPLSDHDIVVYTGARVPDASVSMTFKTERSDKEIVCSLVASVDAPKLQRKSVVCRKYGSIDYALDVVEVASGARYAPGMNSVIGHLVRYAQWAPKGHVLNPNGDMPELHFAPIDRLYEPYIPEGVPLGTLEHSVRVYRELVRGCLAMRGHEPPPGRILDDMWCDPVTRAQVRAAVNAEFGEDRYPYIYETFVPGGLSLVSGAYDND